MQTYAIKTKKSNVRRPAATTEQREAEPANAGNINLGGGRSLDLPEALHARVQAQFGFSPESIRIKESSQVSDMGAKAMAQGNVISFAPGVYDPHTTAGQAIIGHELHHIAEQARGLGSNAESGNIHYDPLSEAASDMAGSLFATSGEHTLSTPSVTPVSVSSTPVQGLGLKSLFGRGGKKAKKSIDNAFMEDPIDVAMEDGFEEKRSEFDYYDYSLPYEPGKKYKDSGMGFWDSMRLYGTPTPPVEEESGGLFSKLWSGIKDMGSGIASKFKRRKPRGKNVFGEMNWRA